MRRQAKFDGFRAYVACVVIGAGAALAVLFLQASHHFHLPHPGELAVLAGLLGLSEQRPLVVQRKRGRDSLTLSAIFACAMLLRWDVVVVVVVQALASLVEDVRAKRPWWKSAFNVAQYTLSLASAGLIYHTLQPAGFGTHLGALSVSSILAAGCTFFALNTVITGTAVALSEQLAVRDLLVDDLAFQASVNGTMAALAPLVVAVVDHSLWLTPLLLLPAIAVFQGARLSLDKEHRSRHDTLTDLPNRIFFAEAAEHAIAEAGRHSRQIGIMMIDLDSFKELNDTLGHSSGDKLLRQIGSRLMPALPPGHTLARLGGDEFGVLLPVVEGIYGARQAARKLLDQLEEPFEIEGLSLDVRASIGVAVCPEHGTEIEELMQHADVAMYLAKRTRRGCEVYDPDRNHHSRRRLRVLSELRPAIAAGTPRVYYQPKADMRDGRICGLEALLRWPHPELGMISPAEFIPLAEYTGLIHPLTEYALDQTFDQIRAWWQCGLNVPVSVNLSARVLHDPGLPQRIAARLDATQLPASAIVAELTETAVMAEPDSSLRLLHELSDMGIQLSIDDFGTGYSSLAYLSTLPVAEIKIDKSFVTHLDTHANNQVIVRSTIELARNLGLHVVAEGVETIAVWKTLAGLGCDVAQGYLIGRPEEAAVVTELLRPATGGAARPAPAAPTGPIVQPELRFL